MRTHHYAIAAILGATPTLAHAGDSNVVHVYSVTGANVLTETDVEDVADAHPAGWSMVRPYRSGGNHYAFAIKRQTGEAQIFAATAGDMGNPTGGVYDLGYDWTSAAVYYVGAQPYLVLHRSRDGEVWRFALPSDGTLGAKTVWSGVTAWRDKSDFQPYFHGGALHFSATDRWTGKAAFYAGDGTPVASATWTKGWTSADYFDAGVAGTWRVLYKPLETPGDERGRLVVQKVGANGAASPTLSDATVSGWTHVRFVRTPPPGGSTRIFLYDNTTGNWQLRSFSTTTGLGAVVASGTQGAGTNIAPNLVDISVYAPGSTAYIYGVQEDGNPVLSPTELDSLAGGPDGPDADAQGYGSATSVFNALPSASADGESPGGWELAYMQAGRLVVRADAGMSNYGEDIALDGTQHRVNWGSVTKALTGVSLVKLAERGEIDLDAPLEVYLDPEAYPDISTDNRFITTRELIEYRSGWDGQAGCGNNCETNWQCTGELEIPRGCDSCALNADGSKTCGVAYANANFLVGRSVIEWAMGQQQPADVEENNEFVPTDLVAYFKWLWWDRAGVGEMLCMPDPETHADTRAESEQLYYRISDCTGYSAAECVELDGFDLDWHESDYPHSEPGNSAACGQGAIQSTAEMMTRMLASLRYERVLSPDGTAYVLQANPNGGERVGFYGTTYDDTVSPAEWFVGKNGATTDISAGLIQRFGYGVDCALVTNQRGAGYDVSETLKDSWLERTTP
jgi:hypothetical protein